MMLIHDASGAVVVVSAESVRIVGEGCIVLNARAVYIHNQALTPEQAAIVKRGVMATLDDPAALEDLHGKHDVAGVVHGQPAQILRRPRRRRAHGPPRGAGTVLTVRHGRLG